MKKLFEAMRQLLCTHYWAKDGEYDVIHNKMHEWKVCIKCGKVR